MLTLFFSMFLADRLRRHDDDGAGEDGLGAGKYLLSLSLFEFMVCILSQDRNKLLIL